MRSAFFLSSFLFAAIVVSIQEYHPQVSPTDRVTFKFNEKYPSFSADSLRLMSFGYSRLLSNLLWIRFVIQTPPERVPENELSWIYFDLESITNIDPDFRVAFEVGGLFLSVITTDKKGAELILQKGIKQYPDSWKLYSLLAYHYQFELNQPERSGPYYLAASKVPGAPAIMGMLAARYLSKTESLDSAIELLDNMKANAKDDLTKFRIQERIDMWNKKRGVKK